MTRLQPGNGNNPMGMSMAMGITLKLGNGEEQELTDCMGMRGNGSVKIHSWSSPIGTFAARQMKVVK